MSLIRIVTRRSSLQPVRVLYLANTVPLPPGKVYGCCFLKTWPTLLQGMISRLPPHCHTRNEISKHIGRQFRFYECISRSEPHTLFTVRFLPFLHLHTCCLNGRPRTPASEVSMPFWVTLPSPETHESFCLFLTISLLPSEQSMNEETNVFSSRSFLNKLCTVWFSPIGTGHKHIPNNSVIVWDQLAPGRLDIISFPFITFLNRKPGWALERPY